jgi:hypothetical protein
VTEQENWSWRYKAKSGSGESVTISPTDSENKITIQNEKTNKSWLSSVTAAVNRWSGNGSTVERKDGGIA